MDVFLFDSLFQRCFQQNLCAEEEQYVVPTEIQVISQTLAVGIAQVHLGDRGIARYQQGADAAAKRIPEYNQILARGRIGVYNAEHTHRIG